MKEKRVEGLSDIRDESDRDGMRIVLDVKKGEPSQIILNNLYKHTQLQDTFGVIFLAIVDQRPRVLNLLEASELFIDFRREVVRRRTLYELRKAEARAHILEGLVIALDHLDQVIALIRAAKTPPEAKTGLISEFGLSVLQAEAILEMQLQRLTGLERQKVIDELKELRVLIAELKEILASASRVDEIVAGELRKIRDDHGNPRRTEILDSVDEITIEDMIADEEVAISITHTGYIKRTSISTYRSQKRGGRGRVGMKTKEEDFVSSLFIATTHSYILILTDRGRVYWLKVHEIPDVGPQGKGKAVVNLVQLQTAEKIAAFCAVRGFDAGGHLFLVTRKGIVKKTELAAFSNPRPSGIIALSVEDGDALDRRRPHLGHRQDPPRHPRRHGHPVQRGGRAAHGPHRLRRQGHRARRGRPGRGPGGGHATGTVLTVTENGYGKRTAIDEYRVQSRGGKGLINIKTAGRNGRVVGVKFLRGDEGVMLITEKGMIIRLNTARHLDHRPEYARGSSHQSRRGRPSRFGGQVGRARGSRAGGRGGARTGEHARLVGSGPGLHRFGSTRTYGQGSTRPLVCRDHEAAVPPVKEEE